MAETTIEWTRGPSGEQGYTFNPWIGCTKVSPACDHCYAARQDEFRKWTPEGWGGPRRRTVPSNWGKVKAWDRKAAKDGTRPRVFCASLADWLDNEVPIGWLVDLLDLVRQTPNLDWLLLSKRIGNWRKRLEEAAEATVGKQMALNQWLTQWLFARTPPANVWVMATICNQPEADRDVAKLLAVPARVRGLSIEPMLGPILLPGGLWASASEQALHWVICGGESGPHARPMHPDWARGLRDQCKASGVAFFFKQWGEWLPTACSTDEQADLPARVGFVREDGSLNLSNCEFFGGDEQVARIGKAAAGRLLDGRTHEEFPAWVWKRQPLQQPLEGLLL